MRVGGSHCPRTTETQRAPLSLHQGRTWQEACGPESSPLQTLALDMQPPDLREVSLFGSHPV